MDSATANLGINIKVLSVPITLEDFQCQRLGKYRYISLTYRYLRLQLLLLLTFSDDEHLTSVSEFPVYKVHKERHQEPVRRTLCLSETCLLERDPQTYSVCTLRPLCDVFALVRDNDNPQLFSIEYVNGHIRTYTATERDALLASLLDSVRASGNDHILSQWKRFFDFD